MGTNYYLNTDVCSKCNRPDKKIHLGKSSLGWKFHFQGNNYEFYHDWKSMQKWIQEQLSKGAQIRDEYGEIMTYEDFVEMVCLKFKTKNDDEFKYSENRGGHPFTNSEFL